MPEIGFFQAKAKSYQQFFAPLMIRGNQAFLDEIRHKVVSYLRMGFLHQIIDLTKVSEVKEIDLGSLIELRFAFQGQGGDILLTHLNPKIREFIQTYSLDRVIKDFSSAREALQFLTSRKTECEFLGRFYSLNFLQLTPDHPALVIHLAEEMSPEDYALLQRGVKHLCDLGHVFVILDVRSLQSPSPQILDALAGLSEYWADRQGSILLLHLHDSLQALLNQSDSLHIQKVPDSPEQYDLFRLLPQGAEVEEIPAKGKKDIAFPTPRFASSAPEPPFLECLTALDVEIYPLDRKGEGQAVFMKLNGRLNVSNYNEFAEVIEKHVKEKQHHFALDMSTMEYINSTALSLLIQLSYNIDEKGGKLCLYGVNTNVEGIIDMMGMDEVLTLVEGEEEAKKLLSVPREGTPSPVFETKEESEETEVPDQEGEEEGENSKDPLPPE